MSDSIFIDGDATWFDGDATWDKGKALKLSIPASKIDADLTDFPVVVNLGESVGASRQDVDDDFTRDDGSPPDPVLWDLASGSVSNGSIDINGNQVRFIQQLAASGPSYNYVLSNFKFRGDFDVEVGFGYAVNKVGVYQLFCLFDYPGTYVGALQNQFISRISYGTSEFDTLGKTWGAFRIIRTGTSIVFQGKIESGSFVTLLSGTLPDARDTGIKFGMEGWNADSSSSTTVFDNFIVNSGTIVWPNGDPGKIDASHFFSELEYPVDDDFTGTNGDAPDSVRWEAETPAKWTIQDGKLQCVATDTWEYLSTGFYLLGNFDVEVEFDCSDALSSGEWHDRIWMQSTTSVDQALFMGRSYYNATNMYLSNSREASVWDSAIQTASSDTTGKIRVARVGNVVTGYYWNGSSWVSQATKTFGSAEVLQLYLITSADGGGSTNFLFDNFTVNSADGIYWPNGEPNRKKVRFMPSDKSAQYYAEIEPGANFSLKKAVYHVKVPSILAASGFEGYLFLDSTFDDSAYIGDTGDAAAQAVWDSNFKAVYHMAQDPSGGTDCIKDSTSNANHGTPQGSMTSADLVDGEVGKAIDFDGVDDRIDIGDIDISNQITLEALIDITAYSSGNGHAMVKANSFILKTNQFSNNNYPRFQLYDGSGWNTLEDTSALSLGNLHHFVGTWDGSTMRMYVNGVDIGTTVSFSGSINQNDEVVNIGAYQSLVNTFFQGKMGFSAIANIARSAAWIKATSYSLHDNLITFEQSAEPYATPCETPVFDPVAGEYLNSQTIAITCATAGATIHYTTDGTDPTVSDPAYSSPIAISHGMTLKAIAAADGHLDSEIASATYTIPQTAAPTVYPAAGTYTIGTPIQLFQAEVGQKFYYTTDGSTPTTSSTLYTGPLSLTADMTLKVLTTRSGYRDADVLTAAFLVKAPQEWNEFRNLGPDAWNFTEQPDKWGYLNNPRWTASPAHDNQHLPCGHWHKRPKPSGSAEATVEVEGVFPGEWVAAVSELSRPYIYVYDIDAYQVVKIDVSTTNPTIVDWLVINDADYILDYDRGYGIPGSQRGGYCISKEDGVLWYLFRNPSNGDVRVVSVDITGEWMSIKKSTVHASLMAISVTEANYDNKSNGYERINDAAGTDSVVFFPTNKRSLRVFKFDSDHNLTVKDWGMAIQTYAESISTCDIKLSVNRINFVFTRDPFITIYFRVCDFSFNVVSNNTEPEGGSDPGAWQNLYRWDDTYDFHFHHRAYWPANGILWRGDDFGAHWPRNFIQTQQYVQSYCGSNATHYFFVKHDNEDPIKEYRLVRAEKKPITSQAEPYIEVDVEWYCGFSDGLAATKSTSTFNRSAGKSCIFKYRASENKNYISTFNQSLGLVSSIGLNSGSKITTVQTIVHAFPGQETDNEPQVWALPGSTYDKKNNK